MLKSKETIHAEWSLNPTLEGVLKNQKILCSMLLEIRDVVCKGQETNRVCGEKEFHKLVTAVSTGSVGDVFGEFASGVAESWSNPMFDRIQDKPKDDTKGGI
jgi:hypothetical protein